MQTFRIIDENPSHENAASKLVPAAVRFVVLAKFVRSKQHSALLFDGFEQLHKPLLFLVCQLGYVPLGFLTRHAVHLLSPAIIRP